MASLEQEILHSMIEYPQMIDEFLQSVPLMCFSKEAQILLSLINELKDQNALNIQTFLNRLSEERKKSTYILDMLASLPNSNYVHLAEEFLFDYKIQAQRQNALKLLSACDNKTLIDITSLESNIAPNEYKTLENWIAFYRDKPQVQKFKTHIEFLDSVFDGGIEAAQLVLISGDPEAGKTTLGLQMLENISQYAKVGFFSFEFTIEQYIKAKQTSKKPPNLKNMYIINDGYELYMIAQNIKNLYRQGVRVFLIDSQMRITSPQGRNMEEEESLKFSLLAKLCHSLGIVVFLIVQTSKSDRDNPMGSKKGGHEASITIRIEHCKAEFEELREFSEESRMIILKKNKQTGKHYKEKVGFDSKERKFVSLQSHTKPTQEVELSEVISVVQI